MFNAEAELPVTKKIAIKSAFDTTVTLQILRNQPGDEEEPGL
jgi:hypothetical protein